MANESVVIHACYSLRSSSCGAAVSKLRRQKRAEMGLSAACLPCPTENLVQGRSWRRVPALCQSPSSDMPVVTASLRSHPAGDQVHTGPRLEAVHCASGVTVRWRCREADKGKRGPFGWYRGGQPLGSIVKTSKTLWLVYQKNPNKLNPEPPPKPKETPCLGSPTGEAGNFSRSPHRR